MADDKTTAAANPAAAAQNEQRTATIRYIDRPEIDEVFADAVTGLLYDGQTLRMEFAVTRFDEIKPNMPISGRRYPSCRLALSPAAAIPLHSAAASLCGVSWSILGRFGVSYRNATIAKNQRECPLRWGFGWSR